MQRRTNINDTEGDERIMSYYYTCPICGANLDPGEQCDCQEYPQHKNMFQRRREAYEEIERAGGERHVDIV